MTHVYGVLAVMVTVICTVAGQMLIKFELARIGEIPSYKHLWAGFFLQVLTTPWILVGLGLAFIGALSYIAALSKLPMTYIYPFASLTFPLVLIIGAWLFGEALTWQKAVGSALIVAGVGLSASSS